MNLDHRLTREHLRRETTCGVNPAGDVTDRLVERQRAQRTPKRDSLFKLLKSRVIEPFSDPRLARNN